MKLMFYVVLFLTLAACGGAESGATAQAPATLETETPATEVASDERQRLSPDQLAAYLPESVGPFPPVPDSYLPQEHVDPNNPNLVASDVTLDYKSPLNRASGRGSYDVRIRISDWRDFPDLATGNLAGVERSGEGRTDLSNGWKEQTKKGEDTWMIERVEEGDFPQVIHEHLFGDRFKIAMTAKPRPDSELSLDELATLLHETYTSSRLSAVGEAPLYAEAEPANGMPAWLGGEDEAPALAAVSCDAALPVAEIERVCQVSGVRAVDTGMASEGDCNRVYKRGDSISGFVFLLSRYGQAETARQALGVASETDREAESRTLRDLGDGGYSFVSSAGEARVAFVAGNALIELKASDSPMDADDLKFCLQREQVEEIARGVVDRITN